MITYSNANNDAVWELIGLSTDEKPTTDKIPNGSTFKEMDTGKTYMYDIESKSWHKQPTASGSSGSTAPDDDETSGDVASDEEVKDAIDGIFG